MNLFGNLCADKLAALGSDLGQVSLQDATNVKWHHSLVKRIQARATIILTAVLQRKSELKKPPKGPKVRKLTTAGLALSTQHKITAISKTLHCHECLKHSSATKQGRAQFLYSPCVPDRQLLKTVTLGNTRPTTIPLGKVVRVGSSQLHTSHSLCVYQVCTTVWSAAIRRVQRHSF